MKKILCLYYSRTGNTGEAMKKIADLLDAELVKITDGKARKGILGFLASGLDAMKIFPEELQPVDTEGALEAYEHIILGTPVWAGRCSSIMRSFLMKSGAQLCPQVSYVITHMGDSPYEQVYTQMDRYLSQPHTFALSLQPKAEDYHQKLYDFVRLFDDAGAAE